MAEHIELRDLSPPGEVLAEALQERSMSNADLARRTSLSEKLISQIVNAKAALSLETAMLLERVLQIPATLWMGLEVAYQAERQRKDERRALKQFATWMRSFPVREMVKFDYIAETGQAIGDRVEALLRFFGVATPEAWEAAWKPVTARFRKSPSFNPSRPALTAWLRQSELVAQRVECQPYTESRFRAAVASVRKMTMLPPSEFCPQAIQQCAAAGVVLTFVPALPGLAISGATRWFGPPRAAIHLSLRGRTDDQMWFSFFHEACHVLEHSTQAIFIDDGRAQASIDPVEARANQFARETLVSRADYEKFVHAKHPASRSVVEVEAFARQQGIAPGIVVGMLQHDGLWPHDRGNKLKRSFRWDCEGGS